MISVVLYALLARLAPGNGWRDTGAFLLIMAALFAAYAAGCISSRMIEERRAVRVIIGSALLFRLVLLPAGLPRETPLAEVVPLLRADLAGREVVFERHLLYDDDHWRYLWDGRVAARGVDPRAYAPEDRRLDGVAGDSAVWQEIREHVNHPWLTTIYPPLPEALFRLLHAVAPASVVALKLMWIVADLLAIVLIRNCLARLQRPASLLLLYAWNPLLIKVTAGSAHFDVLVALGVALLTYGVVRGSRLTLASGWTVAVAAKLTPLLFVLPVVRRLGVRWSAASFAAITLLLAPMMQPGSGGRAFAHDWEFNATFFHLLKMLFAWSADPAWWARGTVAVAAVAAAWWAARDGVSDVDSFARAALFPLGVLLLGGPVLMPWYLVWVLPLAAVTHNHFWFAMTAVVQLAFLVMVDGRERAGVLIAEGLLVIVLLWWFARRKKERGSAIAKPLSG